ncbi:rod shape-determining protein RodA [Algimonas porphyrae]|uniref:Peptidoglycan glycosyltransferase MrdB n=1 Tax=Algimonas porphyrae TaxID=1128113 RepID=A0ABQ5UX74_9PROT|nr:rod shape-determining protein RodA [Algimonas porphyrae]GLQ19307.1 rod shape-determining protein RodA [Algimonas porphyrae]
MTVHFEDRPDVGGKLFRLDWLLPVLIGVLGLIGVLAILSATNGIWERGAIQHAVRFGAAFIGMIIVAMIDIRFWYAVAYPAFLAALVLLLGVEFFGINVNGSVRWLDLGFMRVQPSELIKPAVVLALARYYHDLPSWRVSDPFGLIGAMLIIGIPMALVLRQPDLGTSLLIGATGIALIFLAGVSWRIITLGSILALVSLPFIWQFGLRDYQRSRVLTFLDPARDPAGASYHITQSKIALGSGGLSGKGYLQGTQRQGGYVPENRTDFISTVIGEEFGFIGSIGLLAVYIAVIAACLRLSLQCKAVFSRMLILGLSITFTLYIFINLGMVMGLLPVVGVPLPLVSYGGTVVLVVMGSFGLMLSAHLHTSSLLPRSD